MEVGTEIITSVELLNHIPSIVTFIPATDVGTLPASHPINSSDRGIPFKLIDRRTLGYSGQVSGEADGAGVGGGLEVGKEWSPKRSRASMVLDWGPNKCGTEIGEKLAMSFKDGWVEGSVVGVTGRKIIW